MMVFFWLFLFHLVSCGRLRPGRGGANSTILDRYDKTCGARTMPIIFDVTGMRIENYIAFMNATYTLIENIPDDPKMNIDFQRCKSREDLNSCEDFHGIKSVSFCNSINAPGFYHTFTSTFEPAFKCPLKKGFYKTDRGRFNLRGLILLPTKPWYWKSAVKFFERNTDRKLCCIKGQCYFNRSINHQVTVFALNKVGV